jgi:LysW-gamma-L-lysine carboxypeptidase
VPVSVHGELSTARLDLDCRIPVGFDLDAFRAALLTAAGPHRLTFSPAVTATCGSRGSAPARALSAAIAELGGRPGFRVKTGTSDLNLVAEHWAVPVVAYGPGDGALDHGDDEHVQLAEYLQAIDVLAAALPRLSFASPRGRQFHGDRNAQGRAGPDIEPPAGRR